MKRLSIILTVTEEGTYLRETAEAALAAASALRVKTELIVALHTVREKAMHKQLRRLPCRLCASETASPAALCNAGERAAKGQYLLFLEEGVILTEEGLRKMLETLLLNDEIAAVGPFCNRTNFAWQYINAEAMEEQGEHPADWVRTTLTGATESLFLEGFALLVRRSAFQAVQGFDEAFTGGGADLDLSFRLKYEGFHLLRAPVYLAHRAANSCELYDMVRTEARPLLMERWGIDIGLPETILQELLGGIVWTHDLPLIRATARTALCKAPLVSIMIPTYNRPTYFRETLESALSQTYPNIEVIVCDNSTDDRTEELMQAYRADVRVRYVRNREAKTKEENFMPFEHLAQGEYLQWCMDDDILLSDKITRMVDAFLSEPTATLVTSVRGVIDGDGAYLGQWQDAPPIRGRYGCFAGAAVGHVMLTNAASFLGEPSAVLFRRRDLTHHYWRAESRGYLAISDCAMWLELLEKGDAVIFARPLSLYRRHEGQEGVRADTLVLSRIEWRRLIEEYWRRRVFLTEETDYRTVMDLLLGSDREMIEPLLAQVSPELRRTYETSTSLLHIVLMNRIDGCAPVRLDAPLKPLVERGLISLSGCVQADDLTISLRDVAPHDSILLMERRWLLCSGEVSQVLSGLTARGNILLQEFDDHPLISEEIVRENYFTFRAISTVQTSTQYLADVLREFNPHIYLFENQLASLPEQRIYNMQNERVTIFFGALNRRPDWEPLMPAINASIRRYGDRLYFHVLSDHAFYEALETEEKDFAGGVRDASIVAPYERYTAALHDADIALLPLRDTEFNRAKSDLKFIEAAGHGAVALASPTVYAETMRDGETGLIFRSPEEFAKKLDLLIECADLRRTLAEHAYRYVAEHRLLEYHLDDYISAYQEMLARREEFERDRRARIAKFFPQL